MSRIGCGERRDVYPGRWDAPKAHLPQSPPGWGGAGRSCSGAGGPPGGARAPALPGGPSRSHGEPRQKVCVQVEGRPLASAGTHHNITSHRKDFKEF